MVNCKVCGKVINEEKEFKGICNTCVNNYYTLIKDFLDKYSGMSYIEAIFHEKIPVPRSVFYAFYKAGYFKTRNDA